MKERRISGSSIWVEGPSKTTDVACKGVDGGLMMGGPMARQDIHQRKRKLLIPRFWDMYFHWPLLVY